VCVRAFSSRRSLYVSLLYVCVCVCVCGRIVITFDCVCGRIMNTSGCVCVGEL
jgi:hypothetical protein